MDMLEKDLAVNEIRMQMNNIAMRRSRMISFVKIILIFWVFLLLQIFFPGG
jgi:hypothetical protein